jgi:hypothetical protein
MDSAGRADREQAPAAAGRGRRPGMRAVAGMTAAGAAVAATVLVATLAGSSPRTTPASPPETGRAGPGATAPGSTPAGPRRVTREGRFTVPWSLDGGRLRVDPAPAGQRPAHTRAEAVTAMHTATDRYWRAAVNLSESGDAVDGGAAYGLVTLGLPVGNGDGNPPVAALPETGVYHRRPAWVVWYRVVNTVFSCPMMATGHTPAGQLPDPDAAWEVFVLPDQVDGAVRYRASVARCGRAMPATAWVAAQHLGVAWQVAVRHGDHYTLRYTLPGCATHAATDGEGDGRTARVTIVIAQTFARLPCPAPTERTLDYDAQPGARLVPGPVGLLPVGG